jgi:hypothetical protein
LGVPLIYIVELQLVLKMSILMFLTMSTISLNRWRSRGVKGVNVNGFLYVGHGRLDN